MPFNLFHQRESGKTFKESAQEESECASAKRALVLGASTKCSVYKTPWELSVSVSPGFIR